MVFVMCSVAEHGDPFGHALNEYNFTVQTQNERQTVHLLYAKRVICACRWQQSYSGFWFSILALLTEQTKQFLCNHGKSMGNSWSLCYALLWWWITAYVSAIFISLTLQSSPCMCTEINWTLRLKGTVFMNQIVLRSPFFSCFLTLAALSNLKMGDIILFSLTVWFRDWILYKTCHPLVKKQELIPRISTLQKQTKNPILCIDKMVLEQ